MPITLKANVRWGGVDYAPGATIPGLTPSDEAGLVSSNRAEWVGTPSTTSNAAVPVMATTGPGGGNRLTAGGIPVDPFAGRRQMRNSGVQMWEGSPTAAMFTITGQSGAAVNTEQTSDGGLRVWTTVADRYIDLVMPLPVPMAVRAAALEISNLNQQNQCSIYFGVDATWAVDKMISRSFGVGGAILGTSRTGKRNHVWFSGSPPTAEWVNSANLPLDRTLMTHMRLRFAVQAGGVYRSRFPPQLLPGG